MKWMKRIKKKVNNKLERASSHAFELALFYGTSSIIYYTFAQSCTRFAHTASSSAQCPIIFGPGKQKFIFNLLHAFLFSLAEADTSGSNVPFDPSVHHGFRVQR
jgi:hypothetical protein